MEARPEINPVQFLRAELARRTAKNARYSLRSFAQSLGLSHTVLSLAFSGRRKLSRRSARQISERLGLGAREARIFLGEPAHDETDYSTISLETFEAISGWIPYAILSLLEIPDTEPNVRAIARRLNVGETAAAVALENLVRVGLVAKTGGRIRATGRRIKVDNAVSTATTRRFQREMIEKALESLDASLAESRDISSMTLAIDPAQLPYAQARIRKFRRELTAELEDRSRPKEVYNLTIQIYRVTKRR